MRDNAAVVTAQGKVNQAHCGGLIAKALQKVHVLLAKAQQNLACLMKAGRRNDIETSDRIVAGFDRLAFTYANAIEVLGVLALGKAVVIALLLVVVLLVSAVFLLAATATASFALPVFVDVDLVLSVEPSVLLRD